MVTTFTWRILSDVTLTPPPSGGGFSVIMAKIAHIADVHLRDRQYALSCRGEDFYIALSNAVNAAINEGADAIICAGDLFDINRPSADNVSHRLKRLNNHLKEKKVPMFVTSGNHDPACATWIKIYDGDESGGIMPIDHKTVSIGDVKITGIPFCTPSNFKQELSDIDPADIVVWHGDISEFLPYPSEDCVSLNDIPENKFKILAMGHLHIHSKKVRSSDGLIVTYPGSTELCSLSEDVCKQMYLYTFDDKAKLVSVQSVPFETREVQKFILRTELDLENCITGIKPGTMVFVGYDRTIPNVIPRINVVLGSDNIFRPYLLPTEKEKLILSSAEHVTTVTDYLKDHIKDVVDNDIAERIEELCLACVDSKVDHRFVLEKLIATRLNATTIS